MYQIREDVKVCPEDTPFVSITDIFSKDFDRTYETQLLNISIGGLLTNVWSDAPCWIGKKESCCIACSRNLQLEEFFHYKCNEVSFFLGSQEYIAEKVLKKVGTGGCCKMEAIQQKFIIWGDLIFAGNSTEIRPYDICLVKKENSMEKK